MTRFRIITSSLLCIALLPGCATQDLWDWAQVADIGAPEIHAIGIVTHETHDELFFRILTSEQGPDANYSLAVNHAWQALDPAATRTKLKAQQLEVRATLPIQLDPFSTLQDYDPCSDYAAVMRRPRTGGLHIVDVFAARRDLGLWLHLGRLELSPRPTSQWRPVLAGLATPFTWTFDVVAGGSAILLTTGLGYRVTSGSSDSHKGFDIR